jgi:hypothetical protein
MIVPDDEICIQNMLGVDAIAPEIEEEYLIRARMLHRQLSGGPIGPVAVVDMLRSLGYGPPVPTSGASDKPVVWRDVVVGTEIDLHIEDQWKSGYTFQGEVGGGTLAIKDGRRIDEYPAYRVRLSAMGLESDLDRKSFTDQATTEVAQGDARADLQNEVETKPQKPETVGAATRVNWGQVKKETVVWYTNGEDTFDARFHRCVKDGMAIIQIDGEPDTRVVERDKILMP